MQRAIVRVRRMVIVATVMLALACFAGLRIWVRQSREQGRLPGALAASRVFAEPQPPPLDEPSEIDVRHSAIEMCWGIYPAVADFDGDGRPDLLVGSKNGRMLVFRNLGTSTIRNFAPSAWFDKLCPNGRIPTG